MFLCKLNTKEHESILDIDADAREIHFALVAAKAQPAARRSSSPSTSRHGQKIKVSSPTG